MEFLMNKQIIVKCMPESLKPVLRKANLFLKTGRYKLEAMVDPEAFQCYCPCCDVKLRSFVSGDFASHPDYYNPVRYRGVEQEVVCPVCGTIPRHRILAVWLAKHKEKLKNKSILCFACEPGIKMWMRRNRITCTTADLFTPADLKLDLCRIDQPDCSWDWIICNHVLEHVADYRKALSELYRILKPGGILIISFPILSSLPTVIEEKAHSGHNTRERLERYGQADHLRVFGADSKEILSSFNFRVAVIDGSKMPESILPVTGPADYDVNYLFLCRKQ